MIPLAAFLVLAQQCAPAVAPATMAAVVPVESGFNRTRSGWCMAVSSGNQ